MKLKCRRSVGVFVGIMGSALQVASCGLNERRSHHVPALRSSNPHQYPSKILYKNVHNFISSFEKLLHNFYRGSIELMENFYRISSHSSYFLLETTCDGAALYTRPVARAFTVLS